MKQKREGYLLIFGYLGAFLMMVGVIVLLPLVMLLFYPNEINLASYFIIPGVITIVFGFLLSLINHNKELERLKRHEDVVLLLLIWISAIFISAFPFYLTKEYSFSEAVFEMTSGYTTTGMSIYQVSGAPKIFLFFRSLTHFVGGVGLVLVLTSAISDKFGIQLYKAEGHNDRLLPNLVKSARFIFAIYIGYIVIGTLFYIMFGMSAFDAVNFAISAVSTGGFVPIVDNIAFYNSVPIEIVTIILMLLGATNFMVHLHLFKRKFKKIFKHIELKFLLIYGMVMILFLALSSSGLQLGESLRFNVFHFVSAMSSSGLLNTTKTLASNPNVFLIFTIVIMAIGGGIGSTTGGLKHYRVALFLKSNRWHFKEKYENPRVIEAKHYYYLGEKKRVTTKELNSIYGYISIYLMILLIGVVVVASFDYSFLDSAFEVSSLLGNGGLSIGIMTTPGRSHILLWIGTLIMLLGRLEIYPIMLGITKVYLDVKKTVKN